MKSLPRSRTPRAAAASSYVRGGIMQAHMVRAHPRSSASSVSGTQYRIEMPSAASRSSSTAWNPSPTYNLMAIRPESPMRLNPKRA